MLRKIWKLIKDGAIFKRLWATSLIYFFIESNIKIHNICREIASAMIDNDTKLWYASFLSIKTIQNSLRSSSKSISSRCNSLIHLKAVKSPNDFHPNTIRVLMLHRSTSRVEEIHLVLARTNLPWSSLMQIDISILFRALENDTSTLHLYILRKGLNHVEDVVVLLDTCVTFFWEFCQHVNNEDSELWLYYFIAKQL